VISVKQAEMLSTCRSFMRIMVSMEIPRLTTSTHPWRNDHVKFNVAGLSGPEDWARQYLRQHSPLKKAQNVTDRSIPSRLGR
jgi:hypothetical protein